MVEASYDVGRTNGFSSATAAAEDLQVTMYSTRHECVLSSNRYPSSQFIIMPNCPPFLHMKKDLQSGDVCHPVASGGHSADKACPDSDSCDS